MSEQIPKGRLDRARQEIAAAEAAKAVEPMPDELKAEVAARRADMLEGQEYNYQPRQLRKAKAEDTDEMVTQTKPEDENEPTEPTMPPPPESPEEGEQTEPSDEGVDDGESDERSDPPRPQARARK